MTAESTINAHPMPVRSANAGALTPLISAPGLNFRKNRNAPIPATTQKTSRQTRKTITGTKEAAADIAIQRLSANASGLRR